MNSVEKRRFHLGRIIDTSISSTGSIVNIGNCMEIGDSFSTELGTLHCTNHALCNTIDDNEADGPAQGSAILIQDNGGLYANPLSMRGNHVAHAIRIVGDGAQIPLSDCLIAGNTVAHELVDATGNVTGMTIESCTFANNLIGATHVIHTESDLSINGTIIAEPGTLALDYSGNPDNLVVHYVVSNDTSTLPAALRVVEGTPAFVDLARGDYHLKAGQRLGLDLAPGPTGFDRTYGVDLDGLPRTIDPAEIINAYGARDIGAYEVQNLFRERGAVDSVYCDG